jgi:hypothetical protein
MNLITHLNLVLKLKMNVCTSPYGIMLAQGQLYFTFYSKRKVPSVMCFVFVCGIIYVKVGFKAPPHTYLLQINLFKDLSFSFCIIRTSC